MTSPSVCVFCSSSNAVDVAYHAAAAQTGSQLASAGFSLIYGGTRIGLMGTVARAARDGGASVTGIVPEHIRAHVPECEDPEALIVTPDMRQRKAQMEARADAFLTLPGGFGTLEEVLEVLTLKQLGLHRKPIVFLNTQGFFDPLSALFEELYRQRFARDEYRSLYRFAATPAEAIAQIRDGLATQASEAGPPLTKWT
jgi:uncharacterized protein (TIGR00730 family)